MLSLSLAAILEKNKLSSDKPWILLLEVQLSASVPGSMVRFARNTEDVVFGGKLYQKFNFELDSLEEKGQAELPQVVLRVSNVSRILEGFLTAYSGGVGATVNLYVVNEANTGGEPDLAMQFTIVTSSADANWVTFELGADNPMRKPFPRHYYLATSCRLIYNTPTMRAVLPDGDPRGKFCKASGLLDNVADPVTGIVPYPLADDLSCDKTWTGPNGCAAHKNQINFGGFPNLDQQAISGI